MNSSTSPTAMLNEDDIAEYLSKTPAFFERYAALMGSIPFTSPHSGRAISLQERQAEMLRDKIKGLEGRIMEMVRSGNENTSISHKVHNWSASLLRIQDPLELPRAVVSGLRSLFDVPYATVRVWDVAPAYAHASFNKDVSDDARAFASSLTMPFCGPNLGFEAGNWLLQDAGEQSQSMALLPLRAGAIDSATPAFGLLVLGSPDPYRFEATMGVEFLSRMAELASAALIRLK